MNAQEFRAEVAAALAEWAAFYSNPLLGIATGTVPFFAENGPDPDHNALRYWVEMELRFYGARPLAVGLKAGGRHSGTISIGVYIREGEGTQLTDTLLGELTQLLGSRRFGAAAWTLYPERTIPPNPPLLGWYRAGLLVPFILDERS